MERVIDNPAQGDTRAGVKINTTDSQPNCSKATKKITEVFKPCLLKPDTKFFNTLLTMYRRGSLNRFEAARLCHDTALNSTVPALQKKGIRIDRKFETVPCVNGTKRVSVCRYSIPEDQMKIARIMLGLEGDV